MDEELHHDIIKADPRAFRNVILILLSGVVLGVLAFTWWLPLFSEYLSGIPPKRALRILIWTISVMSLGPLIAGYFAMKLGLRIVRTQSFPPPGTKVWKDTKVIRGGKAKFRGIFLISLSLIIITAGIFIGILPHKLYKLVDKQYGDKVESNKSLMEDAAKSRRAP